MSDADARLPLSLKRDDGTKALLPSFGFEGTTGRDVSTAGSFDLRSKTTSGLCDRCPLPISEIIDAGYPLGSKLVSPVKYHSDPGHLGAELSHLLKHLL